MRSTAFIIALMLLVSCSGGSEKTHEVAMMLEVAEPGQQIQNSPTQPAPLSEKTPPSVIRKLVRNGKIEFETENPEKARRQIHAAAASNAGYISFDKQSKFSDRLQYTIVARVPANNFERFLSAATSGVDYFDTKEIKVEDVTAEYLDQESRIRTKRQIEERYQQLLVKATSVRDVLEIEKELGSVRTEIESAEGKLKMLKDQVQYSTVSIGFYQVNTAPNLFSQKLRPAFAEGWENLLSFLLIAIEIWPFLLLFPFCYLLMKAIRKKRASAKTSRSAT